MTEPETRNKFPQQTEIIEERKQVLPSEDLEAKKSLIDLADRKEKSKKFYYHVADNGYIFDKRIFWSIIILAISIVGAVGYAEGFDFKYKFYMECPGPQQCINPLYEGQAYNPATNYDYKADCTAGWCTQKMLAPGTYGEKPNPIFKFFPLILFSLVLCGMGVNHLVHNLGREFGIKLNLSPKLLAKLKQKGETFKDEDGGEDE